MQKMVLVLFSLCFAVAGSSFFIQAQTDDDEAALFARTRDAIMAFQEVTSYQYTSTWTASGSIFGGTEDAILIEENYAITADLTHMATLAGSFSEATNIQQTHQFDLDQSTLNMESPYELGLDAEIRLVDGVIYANADYTVEPPDAEDMPDDWFIATDFELNLWNILSIRLDGNYLQGFPFVQAFGEKGQDEIEAIFQEHVIAVTLEPGQLDDGQPVDFVHFSFDKEGLQAMQPVFNRTDPVELALFNALEDAAMIYTFIVDENDTLLGIDVFITLGVDSVDVSDATGVEGFSLSVAYAQNLTSRYTAHNAELPLVAAPEIAAPVLEAQEYPADMPWWNDRVFYEVFVRSFYDSDGDGIGDLQGLISKLDYLNDGDPATTDDLGITGIWLMPIADSPSYHGYDATDYYTVNPDYGTNEDFHQLMEEAHTRGIAVIVDLVLNHTSNEHPWFRAASEGNEDYIDWYIWSDDPPRYSGPWGQGVWHSEGDQYYFGLFWSGMPDLNYYNSDVTTQMQDVARFWLEDMGADGFRLDAIKHLFEDGPVMENVPDTFVWMAEFHDYIETVNPDVMTVGEVWDSTSAVVEYIERGAVDLAFDFDLAQSILRSAYSGRSSAVAYQHATVLNNYPPGQFSAFLTNHDQDRLMSQLAGNVGRNKVAASLLLTGPGVPFIYYGEEIGMTGTGAHENIRTPMQWGISCPNACFTEGRPWEPLSPGYATTVFTEQANANSLWHHYQALIQARNQHSALRTGAMLPVESTDIAVYSFLRYNEDNAVLVVVNLGDEAIRQYGLALEEGPLAGITTADWILGEGDLAVPRINGQGGFRLYKPVAELPPQSTLIIELH